MSWQLRLVNFVLQRFGKPMLRGTHTPARARREFNQSAKLLRMPHFVTILADDFGMPDHAIPGTWVSIGKVRTLGLIFYIHGGGYIVGNPATHSAMVARLSQLTGLRAFLPDYRLAPEHPFPAQIDDVLAAWDGLATRGYDPADIIIAGDSAGGGLALALLSHLCRTGAVPAGCVLFSPWTDLTLTGTSLAANLDADRVLPGERISEVVGMYLQGADPSDARASPMLADYPNCPPVFIQAAETEILFEDARRMAEKLRSSGAQVTFDQWPDLPHVWVMGQGWLPEADQALARAATFMTAQLPSPQPTES